MTAESTSARYERLHRPSEHTGNPLGCSNGETDAMDAWIQTGSVKGAAAKLGLQYDTVKTSLYYARNRMGIRSTVQAAVAWAEARRAQGIVLYKRPEPREPLTCEHGVTYGRTCDACGD